MGSCSTGSTGTTGTTGNTGDNSGNEFIPTEENPICVTDAAVEAILNAIKQEGEPGDGIRISVVGGGCSGYQYGLDFEKEPRMDDLTIACGDLSVYVDPVSAGFLKGTTIDYTSGLQGTGFKFNNPNAKRTCGCGSSFS